MNQSHVMQLIKLTVVCLVSVINVKVCTHDVIHYNASNNYDVFHATLSDGTPITYRKGNVESIPRYLWRDTSAIISDIQK